MDSRTRGDSLAWINLLVAVVGALVVVLRTLEIAGCDNQCDFSALEVATRGFWVADVVLFVATTVAYFSSRSRHTWAWVFPAFGLTVTIALLLVTNLAMSSVLATA